MAEIDVQRRIELLRKVWLFSECDDHELARISELTTPMVAETGTAIVREGERGSTFYVIVAGTADATVGRDLVGQLDAGSFFGEMALLDGGERNATVTATSTMHLLRLDRDEFNEMLAVAMPHIAPKLLKVVGWRMRALERRAGGTATFGV